jgi:membrane protease YdiL (CAAX protease family)
LRANRSNPNTDQASAKPYWGYEDIGVFFLILVSLTSVLRLSARFDCLSQSDITNPAASLQFALVTFLTVALYLVLKIRHHQPVMRPLGWVWPRLSYMVASPLAGILLGPAVIHYLRLHDRNAPPVPTIELLVLGAILGPVLEESLFRGCILPVLAQTTGNVAAILITAFLFALLHGPVSLAQWVSFTATGVAYGSIRVASGSTSAAALTHAAIQSDS